MVEMASVLNKLGLSNIFIIMDDASIDKTSEILKAIYDYGHTPLFFTALIASFESNGRVPVKN